MWKASWIVRHDRSINILHGKNEFFELVRREVDSSIDKSKSVREEAYKDCDLVLGVLIEPSLESFIGILIDVFLQCGYASFILDGLANQTDYLLLFNHFDKLFDTFLNGKLLG